MIFFFVTAIFVTISTENGGIYASADAIKQCSEHKSIECDPNSKYRAIDGTCNNLEHPAWGAANGCFLRLQPAVYEGNGNIRRSTAGGPLPQPRELSLSIHKDFNRPTQNISLLFTMFGQAVAHDMSQRKDDDASTACCPLSSTNDPACISVVTRSDDPYYSKYNVTCFPLTRSATCSDSCSGTREQLNQESSFLDASIVYGSTNERSNMLRAFQGGKLQSMKSPEGGELLPSGNNPGDPVCKKLKPSKCFMAGHSQANQHSILTSLHTLFMREHNRIAGILVSMNSSWDDEKLFQEARRIFLAEWQAIIYQQFLPLLLSQQVMDGYGLSSPSDSSGSKYNPNTQIGVFNECGTAAFRLHSMPASQVGVPGHNLSTLFANPYLLREGYVGKFMNGMCQAPSQKFDRWLVKDVTENLKQAPTDKYGFDLASINIQRGRDHGLAPYVDMVNYCTEGNMKIASFDDLEPLVGNSNLIALIEHYKTVEDIDLWVGSQLENHVPGSVLGPTAACIVAKQYHLLKFSDRYFWEHEGEVPSFNEEQRNEFRKSSISRILCDNIDAISSIQRNAFLLQSEQNPTVSCNDIPEVDIKLFS